MACYASPPFFVGRDFAVKKKIYYFCKRERADKDIGISKCAVGSFLAGWQQLKSVAIKIVE